jgi:hypothetical protein
MNSHTLEQVRIKKCYVIVSHIDHVKVFGKLFVSLSDHVKVSSKYLFSLADHTCDTKQMPAIGKPRKFEAGKYFVHQFYSIVWTNKNIFPPYNQDMWDKFRAHMPEFFEHMDKDDDGYLCRACLYRQWDFWSDWSPPHSPQFALMMEYATAAGLDEEEKEDLSTTLAVRRDDLLNWAVESFVEDPIPQDTQQSSASTTWHTPLSPGRNEDDGTSGFRTAPSAENVSNQPSGPSVDSTVLNNLKNNQKRKKPGKLRNGKGSGAFQGTGSSADKENCVETNVPHGQINLCNSLIPFQSNASTEQPSRKAPTTLLPKNFRTKNGMFSSTSPFHS